MYSCWDCAATSANRIGSAAWIDQPPSATRVCHRRRIEGERGQQLMRRRGELLERPMLFSMKRAGCGELLCVSTAILSNDCSCMWRQLSGLWMRTLTRIGTPRGLQGNCAAVLTLCTSGGRATERPPTAEERYQRPNHRPHGPEAGGERPSATPTKTDETESACSRRHRSDSYNVRSLSTARTVATPT